jgi:hypothetical protein
MTQKMTANPRIFTLAGWLKILLLLCLCGMHWNSMAQSIDIPAGQQAVIEIVRLQHRSPELIRDALEPLLDERGNISQIDNNLIISTSRANLTQLQTVINALDVPRRRLLIRVDFAYGNTRAQSQPDGSSSTTIQTRNPGDFPIQSIVVSEGEYAYFDRFTESPINSAVFAPLGLLLTQDTPRSGQSLGASTQILGDRVILEISMAQLTTDPVSGQSQSEIINTTLESEFNQWLVINNRRSASPSNNSDIITTANPEGIIAIRVEAMP